MSDRHDTASSSPLGRVVAHPDRYDPSLLYAIARAPGRAALGPEALAVMRGADFWTAFEISWLSPRGMPRVAVAEITIPCTSPSIVESKSLKLYLNSLNDARFTSPEAVAEQIRSDISTCCGAPVEVSLRRLDDCVREGLRQPVGECLDGIELDEPSFTPDAGCLTTESGASVDEVLYSDLLKTNCPVTGQPDWATVIVDYRGPRVVRAGLLAYILAFRHHSDFHEQCVERMFADLWCRLRPERLSLTARYTRRGGIDINPWRASAPGEPPRVRLARQ